MLEPNDKHLVELLRREARYSGVWFAEHLNRAADLIERLARHHLENSDAQG